MDQNRNIWKEEGRRNQGRVGSSSYNEILCKYRFSCVISLLDFACMVLHVVLFCHGMGFSKCDSFFNLALPFPDNIDVMGSHVLVELDF